MCQVLVTKCLWHRQAASEYRYTAISLRVSAIESGIQPRVSPIAQSTKLLMATGTRSNLSVGVLLAQSVEQSTKAAA
jgi:hypothetical protein